ncbi:MAG TPA: hypothetical protein VLA49_10160 [Anaerolineales bacterium]|nr:hypothetical protein [Anaerolineales bacterium]
MDHVVYLDAKAKELDKLATGEKTIIIRGAMGRKMPYGRVNAGDVLYFLNNDAEGMVRAKAVVARVINTEALTEKESVQLVESHQDGLQLTGKQLKRWGGKRYLVLIELEQFQAVEAFRVDKSNYGNMDDWLPVGNIADVGL